MNKFLYIILFFSCININAQNLLLKINSTLEKENVIIDSISYQKNHENAKSIISEFEKFQNTLYNDGYINQRLISSKKTNDSTFTYVITLNKRIKSIKINFDSIQPDVKKILSINDSFIQIPIDKTESYILNYLQILEKQGYSISQIKLDNQIISDNQINAQLKIILDEKRKIDLITINPYTNFPKGINKQLLKKYIKKDFNQQTITELQKELSQFPFIKTVKPPEVLFTENKTVLYLFLEKANSNQFDGLIGFSNDDNETVRFNGNVDLKLMNILNKGEQFNLYWRNDGNQQSTFNLGTELPYLFQSPIGLKANLQIFKQDSTQQNTKFNASLLYYITYNNKVGLGYQSTTSVAGEFNTYAAQNYSNQFLTLNYEFSHYREHVLFPLQTRITGLAGTGNRKDDNSKVNQQFVDLEAFHHFYLDERNIVYLKGKAYQLFSPSILYNELYRFGGVQNIRGFNENTLQAQSLAGIFTEYRFVLSPTLYAHSITDYVYYIDDSTNTKGNLYSVGLGIGIATPSGLFNLIYANGLQPKQEFKMSNSIIHLSYKTQF